jgi:NAD(P)-dependent dehydrogenase (short-subunit alcohol dehydrogenase family)
MPKYDLRGKSALITGASGGMGRELALAFAERGTHLALSGRDAVELQQTAELVRAKYPSLTVSTVIADVTSAQECRAMVDHAVDALGGLDILVTNAGISMWAPFEEVTDLSIYDTLMRVNYLGAVYSMHAALPHLRARRGRIVAISTAQAWTGMPNHTGYAASKAGLQGFLDSLTMELDGAVGILGVYPGWIRDTGLRASALGATGDALGAQRRAHNSQSVSAAECAAEVVKAVEENRTMLFVPVKMRLLYALRPFAFGRIQRILKNAVRSQQSQH